MEQKINGKKLYMSQVFLENGKVVPVTVVSIDQEITSELENKEVTIVGYSKGKGFTGAMKRWGFKGEQTTRGQSAYPRSPGSVGGQSPGRVLKGKKMAGRHGNKRVTLKDKKIIKVFTEKKELYVSGPIPGARNSKIILRIE